LDDAREPHTDVHRLVRRYLEPAQDLLILVLALALFVLMARTLVTLTFHALAPDVALRAVLGEVLFMLVLVELLRLLIIYLRDHHVSVDVMVEVSIVAALREVLLIGVVHIDGLHLLALTLFLLALGIILRYGDLRRART
jgi:uncharacterized membrane protein (DUF373 family)